MSVSSDTVRDPDRSLGGYILAFSLIVMLCCAIGLHNVSEIQYLDGTSPGVAQNIDNLRSAFGLGICFSIFIATFGMAELVGPTPEEWAQVEAARAERRRRKTQG